MSVADLKSMSKSELVAALKFSVAEKFFSVDQCYRLVHGRRTPGSVFEFVELYNNGFN